MKVYEIIQGCGQAGIALDKESAEMIKDGLYTMGHQGLKVEERDSMYLYIELIRKTERSGLSWEKRAKVVLSILGFNPLEDFKQTVDEDCGCGCGDSCYSWGPKQHHFVKASNENGETITVSTQWFHL